VLLALRPLPCALSQVPQGFNYQAIARDGVSGNPITEPVDIKIAILSDNDPETVIWEEKHSGIDPDEHGLFSIVVGLGTYESGPVTTFSNIDWTVTPRYIRTQIYYDSEWKNLGSAQLQSVPYSLLSEDVETKQTLSLAGSDLSITGGNTVTLPTGGSLWTANAGDIYRPTGNVGIGISSPSATLDVNGTITARSNMNPLSIEINSINTGVRTSYIDFHGDDHWADYALRIRRYENGQDAPSRIEHRGTGPLQIYTSEAAPIDFYTSGSSNHRLRVSSDGNVGIGTSSPTHKLELGGTNSKLFLNSSTANTILFNINGVAPPSTSTRSIGTKLVLYPEVSSSRTDFALGIEGYALWYSIPEAIFDFSHKFYAGTTELMRIRGDGKIGIGTTSPSGKVVIQPSGSWDDNTPLFEVKNKYGVAVLAVYNNGVKINIEHDPDGIKGPKGGFAIGGYDYTKGGTVNLMNVTPDSIRFNINNDNVKGPKGGFAIGGYDYTKGDINEDFMYITPQTSGNGQYNTFMGYQSGYNNLTTGIRNTFFGNMAGYNNASGDNNVFVGASAGQQELGSFNVYLGSNSGSKIPQPPLYTPYDASSENVIIGVNAGIFNEGDYNVIIGKESGKVNDADGQVFVGWGAGKRNTTGYANTFLGGAAGEYNTTGIENTGVGLGALCNSTGNYNTALGYNAGSGVTSGGNNITIGTNSMVPSATGHDQVRIGNTFIVYAGIQVAWTVTSDIKWKESIEDLSLGLNVINGLKPVDYIRKNNSLHTREAGFIAQDVEELFNELGIENAGLLSKGYDGSLELRYNDFIPILTKAIQEQQAQIEQLNAIVAGMKEEIAALRSSPAPR